MKTGWMWFKQAPIPWMGMAALAFLVLSGIGMVPRIGGFVVEILSPFLGSGVLAGCKAVETGEPVTFLHLAAGFRCEGKSRLALMGAIYLAGLLIVDVIMRNMGGEGFQQMAQFAHSSKSLTPDQAQIIVHQAVPAMLTGLVLMLPLMMATWFAPALVLFDDYSTGNALWWSLWACLVNWRPILIYSLWLSLLGVVAMLIPFGLGFLVLLPWVMISSFAAYRSMFATVETA